MDNRPIIILGSARPDSDTRKLVKVLFPESAVTVLDLLDYKVYPYRYSVSYPSDDQFMQLVKEVLPHKQIIFATPVYWYAMSGLMKTFFDRLTDIVTVHKSFGRKLSGKETFLIAVGAEKELPPGFEIPFQLTSDYFDMTYKNCCYCPTNALHHDVSSYREFLKSLNL